MPVQPTAVTLNIKVIPGARKNAYKEEGETIKVYLTAPPVDGKANKALVDLLAQQFKVKKSAVEILKGLKSTQKQVSINQYPTKTARRAIQ